MTIVYLSLGSNLGDREDNLRHALSLISRHMTLTDLSSVYETEPLEYTFQPTFLNMVCAGETYDGPRTILELTQGIEKELGRVTTFKYGPRTLDVDILLYGNEVIDSPELQIPHPLFPGRAFVLVPLSEIAPNIIHPVLGKSIEDLLMGVSGREKVVMFNRMRF